MIDHAVSNSTGLIVLERIGHLDLLPQLIKRLNIPQAVQWETGRRASVQTGYTSEAFRIGLW